MSVEQNNGFSTLASIVGDGAVLEKQSSVDRVAKRDNERMVLAWTGMNRTVNEVQNEKSRVVLTVSHLQAIALNLVCSIQTGAALIRIPSVISYSNHENLSISLRDRLALTVISSSSYYLSDSPSVLP